MEMTTHEKYLAGIPLTEEIATLREKLEGRGAPQSPTPISLPESDRFRDIERNLTRSERLELKEMCATPGWRVLQRLLEKTFQIHKKSAIDISQTDPLCRAQEISEAWAYVILFQRAVREMDLIVSAEITQLDAEEK